MRTPPTQQLVLWMLLLLPAVAAAQPLADRLPEDALIYIGWRGSQDLGPGYAQSHLKAVLDDSGLPRLFDEFLPRLMQMAGGQDAEARQAMAMLATLGPAAWKYPCAFYFGGVSAPTEQSPVPMPRLALLCDAGTDAPALQEALTKLTAKSQGLPLRTYSQGKLVIIEMGKTELDAVAAKKLASLAAKPRFTVAMKQVTAEPVFACYVDIAGLLQLADQFAGANPQTQQSWPKVRDALGLGSLRTFAMSAGFDGRDWASASFLDAPHPRGGLLGACLDAKPLDNDILGVIPQSATLAAASRCDLAALVADVRKAVQAIDASAAQQMDDLLKQGSGLLEQDIERDLLAPLGPQWAVYASPDVGGNGMMGLVLVNRLRNADKAQQSALRLVQSANRAMATVLKDYKAPVQIQILKTQYQGLDVHYLGVPLVAPAWAMRNGNCYVALYPQVAAAAAASRADAKAKSILDNEQFLTLRKRLAADRVDVSAISGVQFMDLPRTAAESYQTLLAVCRLYMGMGDLFGVPAPAMAVPPLDKLLPHLAPAGSISWVDAAGWHCRSLTPFPGATMLAGQQNLLIAQNAMMVSILLPALNSARERANRVKCAANLRGFGQASLLYAQDHAGNCPPDAGTLIKENLLDVQQFACPTAHGAPLGLDKEQKIQWANRNASYIYVAGLTLNSPAHSILAYEKPANHGGQGMNVLFVDGSVQWMPISQAMKLLEDQKQRPAHQPPPRGGNL